MRFSPPGVVAAAISVTGLAVAAGPLTAQVQEYRAVVPATAETDPGLFGVHRVGDRLLFEISDSLFGRDMMLMSRVARTQEGLAEGARGAVLSSDPAFEVMATTSTASSRRWNRVGDEFWGGRITVDPLYRDLTVEGEPDPRVTVFDTETVGHDNTTPVGWPGRSVPRAWLACVSSRCPSRLGERPISSSSRRRAAVRR